MTSPASRKAKPDTFSAPTRLTRSQIESLRADKQRIGARVRELLAQEKAANQAATEEHAARAATAAAE